MMSLDEIRAYYPGYLHSRGEFLLREYLQHKILELIFQSDFASKFVFLGGTCLRIVHNNQRFSEDLDFDNFDLDAKDFEEISQVIRVGLEREGFEIEMRSLVQGAYHCYIRFPGLLFKEGLTGHREAKILINLDTEPQHFQFKPQKFFINRFDVFLNIPTTPLDILLSQKFTAIFKRRRPMGRDFFDAVFLMAKTRPNYDFLQFKLNVSDSEELRANLLAFCDKLDFQVLAQDVLPFLFNPNDIKKVQNFKAYIESAPF